MADRLDPLDFYKWHCKRWRLSRNVQRLSWQARGFYRELLDEQWLEGYVPDDIAELAQICGCPAAVMEEHWPQLAPYFPVIASGQRANPRQEENRTEIDRKRVQQSMAGKASAAARAALAERSLSIRATVVQPEEKSREEKSREEEVLGVPENFEKFPKSVGVGVAPASPTPNLVSPSTQRPHSAHPQRTDGRHGGGRELVSLESILEEASERRTQRRGNAL